MDIPRGIYCTSYIEQMVISIIVRNDFCCSYNIANREQAQSACFAAVRVFFISIAMVMGPTPPGTGVI